MDMNKSKQQNYNIFSVILIVFLGIIIYSNSFQCSFHFDDNNSFVDNAKVHDLNNIKDIWHYSPTRFIGILSLAINYHFSKLDVWNYHFINLLIHLINSLLVFSLVLLIFSTPDLKDTKIAKDKQIIALFTALLFVSHPLATESVTYIVQRLASLAAMFYLLSVVLYAKARLVKSKNKSVCFLFAGSILSAVLAMLTKEISFTLPFTILLIEICFFRKNNFLSIFKDYRLLLLILGGIAIIIVIASTWEINIFKPIPPTEGHTYTLTPMVYLFTQFRVITTYIRLLFLPFGQILDYDYPVSLTLFDIKTLAGLLFLMIVFIFAILFFKKYRIISFGIFWFFLTLAIESSILPINDVIFEHRTYLPSVGFFLAFISAVYFLFWNKYKIYAVSLLSIYIIMNSFLTYNRNKIWKDELSLWTDNVQKTPNFARPFNNLGKAKCFLGDIDGGMKDFNTALSLNPHYYVAYYNRGVTKNLLKDYVGAIEDYNDAIKLDSTSEAIFINRGIAKSKINDHVGAIKDYNKALKLNPSNGDTYFNRGISENFMKEYVNAINDYSKAIGLKSNLNSSYLNRGISKYNNNDHQGACLDWKVAADLGDASANNYILSYCK